MSFKIKKLTKEQIKIIREEMSEFPMVFHAKDIDRQIIGWTPYKKKEKK